MGTEAGHFAGSWASGCQGRRALTSGRMFLECQTMDAASPTAARLLLH